MSLDLTPAAERPWERPAEYWPAWTAATAALDPPLGALHRGALAANAADLARRAQGTPIRVASKSVRVRGVLDAVLALPGFRGVLAYTLAEALWLAETGDERYDDIVVGYPSADRGALARLAADERLAARVAIMVDDPAQLDLVDAAAPAATRAAPIRVALELDSSYRAPVLGHLGVRRSPRRDAAALGALAEEVARRPGFRLAGVMGYEAQIAGVGDADSAIVRAMQRRSAAELAERRGAAVARVREVASAAGADLDFVNGGGTGSIESTREDASVTDIAAGSGLFGPHLFDHYTRFHPAPALAFALPVVRRPTPEIATLLGGGWIASGPAAPDRLPLPVWPEGLRFLPREGAGEVQTPVTGGAAARLAVGDRVWLRHTKAGEVCEHLDVVHVVDGDRIVDELPTYRGEGRLFL
ncbi:MAG: alanine racemase [Actinomycetales bacterium]|nr:alanine racemase [Actinomycetales bacterium]